MATLIATYDGEGKCTGRCDANCYNAKGGHCDCLCGGANHGVGVNQAVQNTRDLANTILQRTDAKAIEIVMYRPVDVQLELLPPEPSC